MKILTTVIFAIVLAVGYLFLHMDAHEENINILESGTSNSSLNRAIVSTEHLEEITPDIERNKLIQALKEKAEDLYIGTLEKGGLAERKKYDYEDTWCVAQEDLSEEDFRYSLYQKKEWLLSRGYVEHLRSQDDSERFALNNEYLDSYRELDEESLIKLAEEDDLLALTTMVQSLGLNNNVRSKAARQLVTLGDTSHGLSKLVMDNLNYAGLAHASGKKVTESKQAIIQALVLVEYGLRRQDVSALETFLLYADKYDVHLNGLNPMDIIGESDFTQLSSLTSLFYEKIDELRSKKLLSRLEDIDTPKVAKIYYEERLSMAYSQYSNIMHSSLIPSSWKDTYIRKTPCISRWIAREDFFTNQLPEIRGKIRKLSKG